MTDDITRRDFVKQTIAGTAALAGASATGLGAEEGSLDPKKKVIAALGSMFIPSRAGDPGYQELEAHGITNYVLENLPGADGAEAFSNGAQAFFGGKSFVDLDEKQRGEYLTLVIDGSKITDVEQRKRLQSFYQAARRRILQAFYSNYPEHRVQRDAQGFAILKPGDTHQEVNPNTSKMVTGWDIAGYGGTPNWTEEEELRNQAKKELPHWFNGDLVSLSPSRPPAAAAIKTREGNDYYDVLVLGGGGAGCIVAGRLAERGINPKTGDRLRVAMIEGGDDWTIRDPGIKPGYGYPIRRRMITNMPDGIGPDGEGGPAYHYPDRDRGGPAGYNFRLVGGCSNHYGGTLWIPADEDFQFYRQASGVDWDLAKFGDAIQEVRDLFCVSTPADSEWTKGDHLWADGGRALGLEMRTPEMSSRNSFGIDGNMNRYDTKGTSLPWAYIGMNNGLKVIANAEVEKILIDKPAGGRPVAVGAVYKDKAGAMHEVRAARIVCACAANWTPLLFYKSGYGPKELLGDKLLVENGNVGRHMTGDFDIITSGYLAEPVSEPGREGEGRGADPWAATTPRPWGELTVQIRSGAGGRNPVGVANSGYAPQFGWDHKEYMRNGNGARHVLTWRTHLGSIPWEWRVLPGKGEMEQIYIDAPRVDATIKEAHEIIRAWHAKMAVKVVKTDLRAFSRPAKEWPPQHVSGTARAGSSRENSVCTSDFDCHDIDNLMITSAAAIPRTFFWSMGPTAVNACYGWRRMVANHFSRGSSTKGFA